MQFQKHPFFFLTIGLITIILWTTPCFSQDSTKTNNTYTMEELTLSNYWDTSDLLWQIPGFWMRDLGIFGQWSSYSFHGQSLNQSNLYLDDAPLLNGWFDTSDLSWVPTSLVQSISYHQNQSGNIEKGLYLNSMSIPQKNPLTRIIYRLGSRAYSITDVTFGQKYSQRFELLGGVIYSNYAKDFTAYENQEFRGYTVHLRMNYSISNNWSVQYQYIHNRLSNHLPFSLQMKQDSLGINHVHSKRYDHLLSLKGNWKDWDIKTHVSHSSHLYNLYNYNYNTKNEIPISISSITNKGLKSINQVTPYWSLNLVSRHFNPPSDNKKRDYFGSALLGAKWNLSSLLATDFGIKSHVLPDQSTELAGHINTDIKLHPNFQFVLSLSKDIRVSNLGERFGFPYFAGYPMTYEDGSGQSNLDAFVSNKNINSENIYNTSIDIHWDPMDKLSIYLSPFYQIIEDPIISVEENNVFQMKNLREYKLTGLSGKFHIGPYYNFKLGGTLTALQAKDINDENLLERPNFWSFSYLRWGHAFFENDLIANIEVSLRQWTEYYSLHYPFSEENVYLYHPSQMLLNAKGTFRIIENFILTYGMENILSEILYSPTGFMLPGRTTKMSITWNLYY